MAASVDNRQLPYLGPGLSGIGRPLKPGLTAHHRSGSPAPGYTFPSSVVNGNATVDYSSSSDDDDEDERSYSLLIRKGNAELEPPVLDSRDESTADSWVERNPSMIRLTGEHPFNAEAPLPRLMHYGFITPVPLHYVRNHGAVPKASWDEWTVEISGLVKKPMRLTMHQLETEFRSREFPVSLVCAGNRCKEQNLVKKTIGFNWGAAAISTSVWRGVPLRAILKRCGIMSNKKGALNVCLEGAEDTPGGGSKYGTSLKKEMAMDPARDIILAYMHNGERLTPDHGFPVRVIIPGFIDGRMVKWLKRIIVTTQESDNYYHFKDNRVLPSHVDAELANAEAWWYKAEYIINEFNVNSVITTPSHEEVLPINSWTTQSPYTLRGYAYSGGGRKVTRVEVTINGGETWEVCGLEHPEKPSRYGKYWCWCFWSMEVEVLDLLGAKEIAVRAWDEAHNTQPENPIWNVMGMMNNSWFRVKTNVCKRYKGEIGIVFEHPTQPGNQSGGWMAKERHLEISSNDKAPTLKKSVSTPFMTAPAKTFSMSEVKQHNSADSAWIIVHGHVYDCTRFLNDHPGGADSILINAGTDCTEEFDAIHSDKAKKMLEDYRIGELTTTGYASVESSPNNSVHGPSGNFPLAPIKEVVAPPPPKSVVVVPPPPPKSVVVVPPPPPKSVVVVPPPPPKSVTVVPPPPPKSVALVPREKIPCKLVEKISLSHDTVKLRFALPKEDQVLGLPVGKHIFVCAVVDGKLCMRAYTPSSDVDTVGYFELVVKVYFKGVHPKFPNGGLMSQHLNQINLNSSIDIKGPLGHIEYTGKGNFLVHGKPKFAKKLAMIAGGTGITPIYQVMQAILKDPEDRTEMSVVYANRTEDDILLRDELDAWAEQHPERVKVWYVVQESVKEGWKYSLGFVTEDILREHIPAVPETALALACGPPPMLQFAVNPNLEKMGYNIKDDLLVF